MEALADMDAVPSWSSVHKRVEVVDAHPDGRPHHVKVTITVTGIMTRNCSNITGGRTGWSGTRAKTAQQHGQHGEYNLTREGDDKTRVRFAITVEPLAPLPEFWVNRARKKILYAALEGLRKRVMDTEGFGPAK